MTDPKPYSLDDKYLLDDGIVALSGVQAPVRLSIDQHKADAQAGLNTATLISGYRGSPLGGFDFLLQGAKRILEQHQVRFLPGVDRSGDAFKHANLTGVGKNGGVLAIAGDDPASKSSTVPSASEIALYDAQMPVLFPGDVQEVLDLGSVGFALSRNSGL